MHYSAWFNRALSVALAVVACGCVAAHHIPYPPTARVFKLAGVIQCQPGTGLSLTDMERPLTDAGLRVLDSYCASIEGGAIPAMCGGSNGVIGVFELSARDAERAEALGFGYTRLLFNVSKASCRLCGVL
jgi:hypothetical protein